LRFTNKPLAFVYPLPNVTIDTLLPLLRSLALDPDFWFQIACAVFLLAILVWLINRPPAQLVAFRGAQGSAAVSRHAITDLVQRVCASTEGVGKSSCAIAVQRGRLALKIRIHLQSSATLTDLTETLQMRVANHLRHSFGFTELGPIDIIATGFQGEANPTVLGKDVRERSTHDLGDNFPATYASGYDLPVEDVRR